MFKNVYIINDGIVINTIIINETDDAADWGAVEGPDNVCNGWSYDAVTKKFLSPEGASTNSTVDQLDAHISDILGAL